MHPEMHLVVYRQQERELEARLAHTLAARDRAAAPRRARRADVDPWRRLATVPDTLARRLRQRVASTGAGTAVACCPA